MEFDTKNVILSRKQYKAKEKDQANPTKFTSLKIPKG
jgi:hypothetical protein